jgi:L-amino acid N-acyltransferase
VARPVLDAPKAAGGAAISIRRSTESDLPAIVEIYNQGVEDGVASCDLSGTDVEGKREWLAAHTDPYAVWVAEQDGLVVGWICLSPYDPKPCFAKTATLSTYVRRSYRRIGAATRLREHLVSEARRRGFHTLVNRVWITNKASIEMSRKFGWKEVGHMKELVHKDGEFIDCLFFQYDL